MARNLICGTHALQDHTWSGWFCVGDRSNALRRRLVSVPKILTLFIPEILSHPAIAGRAKTLSVPLCCAKIPFSFEVDRYNGQPANNRLTFIYALLPEKEPPAIVGLETAVEMKLVRLELCATVVQVDGNCSV